MHAANKGMLMRLAGFVDCIKPDSTTCSNTSIKCTINCTKGTFSHTLRILLFNVILRLLYLVFSFYRSCYDPTAESEIGIELNCLNDQEKEGTL